MGKDYLFTNRKKSFFGNKLFYLALIMIFAFGFWMSRPADDADSPNDDVLTNVGVSSDEQEGKRDGDDNQNSVVTAKQEAYYLLKESEGQIELLHYDETGEEKLIRVTDIPYALISPSDQLEFEEGIMVKDEEELDEILQDFES